MGAFHLRFLLASFLNTLHYSRVLQDVCCGKSLHIWTHVSIGIVATIYYFHLISQYQFYSISILVFLYQDAQFQKEIKRALQYEKEWRNYHKTSTEQDDNDNQFHGQALCHHRDGELIEYIPNEIVLIGFNFSSI